MKYLEQFNACYRYFQGVKKTGPDPIKRIESHIYDQYVEKVVHYLTDKPFIEWLQEAYKTHKRSDLTRLVCDFYTARVRQVTTLPQKNQLLTFAMRGLLSVLTEGVLSTCVEGIEGVQIRKNPDASQFIAVIIKPPIRAGGASAIATTLVGMMYMSTELNYAYKPTPDQLKRYSTEIPQFCRSYPQVINPSGEQVAQLVSRLPICIDGTPTAELVEVNRQVEGVNTEYLRGGAALAIVAPFFVKYKKTIRSAASFGLDMDWLKDLNKVEAAKYESKEVQTDSRFRNWGTDTYLAVTVAGRPIFATHKPGGFRLRVGRSRNTGIGTQGLSPITIALLDFINVGSQMMISGPTKANSVVPVTDLEGPSVELINGNFIEVTEANLELAKAQTKTIYDVGQILVSYGDFLESASAIPPRDYSMEQWRKRYRKHEPHLPKDRDQLVDYSLQNGIMLPPYATPLLNLLTTEEYRSLRTYLLKSRQYVPWCAQLLKTALIYYTLAQNRFVFTWPKLTTAVLLLDCSDVSYRETVLQTIKSNSKLLIGTRGFSCIGARLASVEACTVSTVKPGLSMVYDVRGLTVGNSTDLLAVLSKKSRQKVSAAQMICKACGVETCQQFCLLCNARTSLLDQTPRFTQHDPAHDLRLASKHLGISLTGIRIKVSNGHLARAPYWQPFQKGILRSKYNLQVFKDGTVRYSVSNVTLTHFKPSEIGCSVSRLRQLGYTVDYFGQPLESDCQICVLMPCDVVLNIDVCKTFLKVTHFLDELLVKYYAREPYYLCKRIEDLWGHQVVGLAPHVLNAISGRVIGYTRHLAVMANPLWHAAKRRNADGDKDAVMLLGDVFLNFSELLLKKGTGGLMNVPIIVSRLALSSQVDGEARAVEIVEQYPDEVEKPDVLPSQCPVKTIATIPDYGEFESRYAYTTPTDFIEMPSVHNAYKDLATMSQKVYAQLELCTKLHSVKRATVITALFRKHLLRDLRGNTRKFYKQNFRCTKCNQVYTVLPLDALCKKCAVLVNFTIHIASAEKYKKLALSLVDRMGQQMPEILRDEIRLIIIELERLTNAANGKNRKFSLKNYLS